MKVTDEHVHDSKGLPKLVCDFLKSDKTIGKLFGDGAYDNNNIFRYLLDDGISPHIRVRKNTRASWKKETFLLNDFYQNSYNI